jgi:hypothetical protein
MKKYFTPNRVFIGFMIIFWILIALRLAAPFEPKDDSDFPDHSSSMSVLIDHLTGCQYLSRGSLTPRLDANGKQICKKD